RKLADELRRRLAPGAAVLLRPGKHYPGESLPRWALDLVARRDQVPLWPDRRHDRPAGAADVRRFAEAAARRLGIPDGLIAAYETRGGVIKDEPWVPGGPAPGRATPDVPGGRGRLAGVLPRGVAGGPGWFLRAAPAPPATAATTATDATTT